MPAERNHAKPNYLPLLIASAPNGAYKTQQDHRALPITAAQLADTAAEVWQVGARMLHLHVRDEHGKHTLAAGAYQTAIEAIRARVSDDLFIQCTSEAAGIYTAAQQREAMYALEDVDGVDGVSVSVRELIREDADAPPAKQLFHHLVQQNILAQYILYSEDDVASYCALLKREVIPSGNHSVLLVIGKHDKSANSSSVLRRMVDALPAAVNWMVCAFGKGEFDCLTEAAKLGGHVRIGFENSLHLSAGETATDNRQLITQFIQSGNPNERPLADIRQAKKILGA